MDAIYRTQLAAHAYYCLIVMVCVYACKKADGTDEIFFTTACERSNTAKIIYSYHEQKTAWRSFMQTKRLNRASNQ